MSKQDYRELEAYRKLGKPEELCKKQGWISVKDRLPSWYSSKSCLCAVIIPQAGGGYIRDFAILKIAGYSDNPQWTCEGMIVTHWMPMPEAPKEEQ